MTFNCIANCGKCCGVVPINKDIIEKNKDKIQVKITDTIETSLGPIPLTEDKYCIFLHRQTKQCMIYDVRPDICRKFGIIKELPCPFLKPNGETRTEAKSKQMERELKKELDYVYLKYRKL